MHPKGTFYFIVFILAWICVSWSLGLFDIMNRRPMSVHQGAQCDRACIAQNYYYEGMHFFKPEVNEVIGGTGYVGCEFPLMNYGAAVCYKVFGFNEFWYRLLMYITVTLGMYAGFRILVWYLQNMWIALLCLGLFYFSPILVFYTANFLPDTASLGFAMLAWFFFFRQQVWKEGRINVIAFTAAAAIASAIKVTAAVGFCALACVLVMDHFKWLSADRQAVIRHKGRWWLALLLSAGLAYAWYAYAAYLGRIYTSQYFMMGVPLSENMQQFREAFNVYWSNWPQVTYVPPLITVFGVLLVLLPLTYRRTDRILFWLSLWYAVGSLAFFLLMVQQFKYHDYYVLTLLPSFFFLILVWAVWLKNAGRPFWWVRITAVILLLVTVIYSHGQAAKHLGERYMDGNYWQQSFQQPDDYAGLDTLFAKRFGITRNSRVAVAYDANPNNMLYFLNLRGYRISKDHDNNRVQWLFRQCRPSHLIVSDSTFFTDHHVDSVSWQMLYKTKNLSLFRVNYR